MSGLNKTNSVGLQMQNAAAHFRPLFEHVFMRKGKVEYSKSNNCNMFTVFLHEMSLIFYLYISV